MGPGGEIKATLRPGPLLDSESEYSSASSSSAAGSGVAPLTVRDSSAPVPSASLHLAAAAVGPQGKLAYLLGDDGGMYVLEVATGKQLSAVRAVTGGAEPLGIAHHPHRNLVATYASENKIRLWV